MVDEIMYSGPGRGILDGVEIGATMAWKFSIAKDFFFHPFDVDRIRRESTRLLSMIDIAEISDLLHTIYYLLRFCFCNK